MCMAVLYVLKPEKGKSIEKRAINLFNMVESS